ncbi:MAG: TlpA family protein disulfide reductase [candidate division NC10 bacterium]|nr:TlpA family protein disulfide reductase [candidate division NC10 bacterium]
MEVGALAPDFALKRLDGGGVRIAELKGRPVLINFWATWCAPCRTEMPALVSLWNSQRETGLEVLAVNLTDQERRRDVARFVSEFRIPFSILLDERGRVRERYGLVTLPTTVFVDPAGMVRAIHRGPLTEDALARGLEAIDLAPEPPITAESRGNHVGDSPW